MLTQGLFTGNCFKARLTILGQPAGRLLPKRAFFNKAVHTYFTEKSRAALLKELRLYSPNSKLKCVR